MKNLLLSLVVLLAAFTSASAQTKDNPWNVGVHGGVQMYNGELGNGFAGFGQALYMFGGASVTRHLTSNYWAISLQGNVGEVGYRTTDWANREVGYHARFSHFSLTARYNFVPDYTVVGPYVMAGIGLNYFAKKYQIKDHGFEGGLPTFGFGLNFVLSEKIRLQWQESVSYSVPGNHDGITRSSGDGYWLHSVGLTYNIGKKKDMDGDGVPDDIDQDNNTPAGVKVDAMGVALDGDADGVADYLDSCPELKGTSANKGCPDTDGDGIIDSEDACPNDKGTTAMKGCPDGDGDGIADKDDECPTQAGVADFKGCPDTDKDGVADKADKCPFHAGTAQFNGCPDTDGDGIADPDDKCPTVAGEASEGGCPVVKAEVKKVFAQALQGIQFAAGSDKILPVSFSVLNQVVKIMTDEPTFKLKIDGHTDASGNFDKNMELSVKRAAAVKAYLVSKGVAGDRLTSKGFGSTVPVADNRTPAGRTANRRVELNVEF